VPIELDDERLAAWALPTDVGDKHDRGTVLVIGGSSATVGAALLAGIAALRMGAGRLQLAVDEEVATQLAIAVPESMVIGLPQHPDGSLRPGRSIERLAPLLGSADAVLFGPGLGLRRVARLLRGVVEQAGPETRVVLDAAALAAAAAVGPAALAPLRGRLALTPNRDELAILAESVDAPAGDTGEVAREYGAVVTCFSDIAAPDGRCWTSPPGGPTLATSGSGDVLAGLVAGAAARSADVPRATCWATFVHAVAARHAARHRGTVSVIARDLLDAAAHVLHDIEQARSSSADG